MPRSSPFATDRGRYRLLRALTNYNNTVDQRKKICAHRQTDRSLKKKQIHRKSGLPTAIYSVHFQNLWGLSALPRKLPTNLVPPIKNLRNNQFIIQETVNLQ